MNRVNGLRAFNLFSTAIAILLLSSGIWYLFATARFVDTNTFQKRDNEYLGPLDDKSEIRQGFTSKRSHLAGVELAFITQGYSHKGEFVVNIQLVNDTGGLIATKAFWVPELPQAFDIHFSFRPQRDSLGRKYLLRITTNAPPDTIFLLGSDYDSYSGGEFHTSGDGSIRGDLAFFTYTRPPPQTVLLDTVRNSAQRTIAICLFVLAFFGLGVVPVLLLLRPNDILEIIGFSILIGIAIPPIILFLLSLAGIKSPLTRMPAYIIWLLVGSCYAVAVYIVSKQIWQNKRMKINVPTREQLIFGCLFILACLTRLAQVDDILVPNGVGSFAHLRLIDRIDRIGAIPLDSIYHLGFHSNALLTDWLTDLNLPELTLLLGTFLSIISGVSFYLLARRIMPERMALIATSFYWFISPVPAILINGDRLPFLQGMTLFPAAISILLDNFRIERSSRSLIGLFLVGMFLSHYSTIIFLISILPAIYINETPENRGLFSRIEMGRLSSALLWFLPVGLVFLIKLHFVIFHGSWEQFLFRDPAIIPVTDYETIFRNTIRNGGWISWIAGLLGLFVVVRRYSRLLDIIFYGAAVLLVLSALQYLLTGRAVSNPKNIIYFLSILLSLGAGVSVSLLVENNKRIVWILFCVLIIVGGYNISGILEPRNIFFSRADNQALRWVDQNIPAESTFLINSYPFDGTYNPTDGGGWIPYLTGSKTVFPNSSGDYAGIKDFVQQTGADYIYLGPGYGDLTPANIDKIPNSLLYNKDGIYIYQILDR